MKNTRKVTISISISEVLKTVCAESACLALMSDGERRPAIISTDNRRLLTLYCRNAWLNLAGELASIVDADAFTFDADAFTFDADDNATTLTLPLLLDDDVPAKALRHNAERYIAAMVLAECYAMRSKICEHFRDMAASALAGLRLTATLTDRTAYWL